MIRSARAIRATFYNKLVLSDNFKVSHLQNGMLHHCFKSLCQIKMWGIIKSDCPSVRSFVRPFVCPSVRSNFFFFLKRYAK